MLGFTRVTNSFDARKHCDRRRYEYILPAFMFDPDFRGPGSPVPIGATGGPLILGASSAGASAALSAPSAEDTANRSADAADTRALNEGSRRDTEPAGQDIDADARAVQQPGDGGEAGPAEQLEPGPLQQGGCTQSVGEGADRQSDGGREERPSVRRSFQDGPAAAAAAEAAGCRQCRSQHTIKLCDALLRDSDCFSRLT